MELKTYQSFWGIAPNVFDSERECVRFSEPNRLEDVCRRISDAGYDGVESPMPPPDETRYFNRLLADHRLVFLPMVITVGAGHSQLAGGVKDHLASLRRQLDRAAEFSPEQLSAHGGTDTMTDDEAVEFFEAALEMEREAGIPIAWETHRRRILYTSWRTARLLQRLPELKLLADYSHWVLVAERMLEDRAEDLRIANKRVIHIQGRVGGPEQPQAADPRAPEIKPAIAIYEGWWAEIIRHRLAAGDRYLHFNPEYGAPPYLPTLPYTQQPIADLWEVREWAAEQFRALFEQTVAGA